MTYEEFLRGKIPLATFDGYEVGLEDINPLLRPHQSACVQWAVKGGNRALFEAFGLGKSSQQIEIVRITREKCGGKALIVCPLGVRQEFRRDGMLYGEQWEARARELGFDIDEIRERFGVEFRFIRRTEEIEDGHDFYLTNYESIRDGRLDPALFSVVSLDEASILRSYGSKTFQEFLPLFRGVKHKFVATATPSPNRYKELIHYAGFLGIMDTGQALTRFFQRDSTQANNLTLYPHKIKEFHLWLNSWAIFLQKPSDLGFDDTGYDLPDLKVIYHEVPTRHELAGAEKDGQGIMFRDAAAGLQAASAEKRDSIPARVERIREIILGMEGQSDGRAKGRLFAIDEGGRVLDQMVIWCDLNDEQKAIEVMLKSIGVSYVSLYGNQDIDSREKELLRWLNKEVTVFLSKTEMYGSGVNMQQAHIMIYAGIDYKFNSFIQGIHRVYRFLQKEQVEIHIIYSEAEREILRVLQAKWKQHEELVKNMTAIIKEHGLNHLSLSDILTRTIGCERIEVKSDLFTVANNDCVLEAQRQPENHVDLIVTSIPFANHYEYTPSYNDFGHTDGNAHFWEQMDYLTPELLRILKPGRIYACHVKDRILFGNVTGAGAPTVSPFHCEAIMHGRKHGFDYMGMITVVTDVVRENNQTYRLGWSEQCKDGTKMGVGSPEYVVLFRKPQTDRTRGYADVPVKKEKADAHECPHCGYRPKKGDEIETRAIGDIPIANGIRPHEWKCPECGEYGTFKAIGGYTRARWQVDAHAFWRSSGNRLLTAEELATLGPDKLASAFTEYTLRNLYDYEFHVKIGEDLEARGALPSSFMSLAPGSFHPEVWTDVNRMLTLNTAQSQKRAMLHVCLARDSRVLTSEGYKPIQQVRPGDYVLTHKGRWRHVLVARNTGVRPVVTLRAQGVPGLTLTPDHKLWTRDVGRYARQADYVSKVEPEWVEAEKTKGSYINLKLPPTQHASIEDVEYWWAVGRWLADGHIDKRGTAVISVGRDKWEHFGSCIGRFGGNPPREGTALQIALQDPGRELRNTLLQCGQGAENKQLPPEAYSLPEVQAKALLDGYLSGDGHYLEDRERWMASSASKDLLLGIAMLAQRVYGAVASIHAGRPEREGEIEGRKVHMRQEWVLSFDLPGSRRKKPILLEDGAWKKVRSIEDAGEVETWCLRVEEDESFTAEGCIVKNCPLQFDIVDRLITRYSNPGELVYDPFCGLGTVPYRAIKLGRRGQGSELNPQYFLDSVQYLKAMEAEVSMPSLFDLAEGA